MIVLDVKSAPIAEERKHHIITATNVNGKVTFINAMTNSFVLIALQVNLRKWVVKMTDNEIIKALESNIRECNNIKHGVRKLCLLEVDFLKEVLSLIEQYKTQFEIVCAENSKFKILLRSMAEDGEE